MSIANHTADRTPEPAAAESGRPAAAEDTAMTLSAERLITGTRWVDTGRLTVRRRVVTETRTVEVTVRREELVIDEVQLDADNASMTVQPSADPDHGDHEPLVIVLRREVPDIAVRVEPYEQVHVTTGWVTTEQAVQAAVRHEEVDYDVATRPDEER